jgi:V8-like Glu-specific endopeptidase
VYDRVVRVFPQRLEFVHDVMGGQSGSAIWVRWQTFRSIVGIVTTHDDPLTAIVANTGVRITPSVLADIRRWLTR